MTSSTSSPTAASTQESCDDANTHNNNIVSNAKKIFGSSVLPASFGKYDAFYSSLRDSEIEQRKQQCATMDQLRKYRGDGTCVGARRRQKSRRGAVHHREANSASPASGDDYLIEDSSTSDELSAGGDVFGDISASIELFSGKQGYDNTDSNKSCSLVRPTSIKDFLSDNAVGTSSVSHESVEKHGSAMGESDAAVMCVPTANTSSHGEQYSTKLCHEEKSTEANAVETMTCHTPTPISSVPHNSDEKHEAETHPIKTENEGAEVSISMDMAEAQIPGEKLGTEKESTTKESFDTLPQLPQPDPLGECSTLAGTVAEVENDAKDNLLASPEPAGKMQSSTEEKEPCLPMPTPSPITQSTSESRMEECSPTEQSPTPILSLDISQPLSKEPSSSHECSPVEICDTPMTADKIDEMVVDGPEILLHGDGEATEIEVEGVDASLSKKLFGGEHVDIENKSSTQATSHDCAFCPLPADNHSADESDAGSLNSSNSGGSTNPNAVDIIDTSIQSPGPTSSPQPITHKEELHLPMPTPSPIISQPVQHKESIDNKMRDITYNTPVPEEKMPGHITPQKSSSARNGKTGTKPKPTPASSKRKLPKGTKMTSPPKRQKLEDMFSKLGISPAKSTWGTGVQLYNGRSIERISKMKKCKNKFCQWDPRAHSLQAACERCWTLASREEREEFIANGRHLRIMLVKGGCPSSCTLFSDKTMEISANDSHISRSCYEPVRLCRRCFADMHHVGIRE